MNNPFSEIDARLNNIETLLLDLKHNAISEPQQKPETPILIDDVCKLTGFAKPTIYGYCQRNVIPYHKKGNRLYFFESDIIKWIKEGKQKTLTELSADADAYLANKRSLSNNS